MVSLTTQRTASFTFRWLGSGQVPENFDLRSSDWNLDDETTVSSECINLALAGKVDSKEWRDLASIPEDLRRFVFVIGTFSPEASVKLLKAGFGDVASETITISEFEARASRLADQISWLPRHRTIGELELDLLAREAFGHGKSLNLNPREFALLWRLSDKPGHLVTKQDLIHDVWRMGFIPETNSIAVHMSRLRRKLSFVGMADIIATAASGGYFMIPADQHAPTISHNSTYRSRAGLPMHAAF